MIHRYQFPVRPLFAVAALLLILGSIAPTAIAQSGSRSPNAPPPTGGSMFGSDKPRPAVFGPSLAVTDELVADIRVEGNKTVPAGRILGQMQTRVGRQFDPKALTRDVRKLASLPWFVDVKPLSENTPQGRVIILRVVERPIIRYVEYLGNNKIKDKKLGKETGIEVGDAVDPYAVEEGRRKLQELYISNGYPRAQVTVLEGNESSDQGVVFVINEGVQQKIAAVKFEGNDPSFATDGRLKTKIKSKPGILWLFGGKLNRDMLDADVQKLTDYYREYGFYMARVSRLLEFDEEGKWVTIRFVVDEGPRYHVRNITFIGNQKFSNPSLKSGVKLLETQPFERNRMLADVQWLKDLYGSQGHVFADIRAEPILLEEPGQIDLVYHVDEGEAWRVGRVFVHIGGDNPHTRIQTALNRLSIRSGEIMDIRELKASERRLQASSLFLADPARGVTPTITYSIPEDYEAPMTASRGGRQVRGQSPEASPSLWQRVQKATGLKRQAFKPIVAPRPAEGDRVDLNLLYGEEKLDGNHAVWELQVREPTGVLEKVQAPRPYRHTTYKPPTPSVYERANRTPVNLAWQPTQNSTQQNAAPVTAARPIIRGQSPQSGSIYGGTVPRATSPSAVPAGQASPANYPVQQAAGQYQPSRRGSFPVAQSGYQAPTQQPFQTQTAQLPQAQLPPTGSSFRQDPSVQPTQFAAPNGAPAPRVIGAPYTSPMVDSSILPLPGGPNGQLFPGGEFGPVGPVYTDNTVDIHVRLQEAQTGRFSIGAGINSDAGVVGNITLDERNFDWRRIPTSWSDVTDGTAFRGAGQRFRLEAAPGSQVQRYMASFQEPYLWDTPISLGLSGSYFDRRFEDWDEQRLGGRVSLGYQWTANDLSASLSYRGEQVKIHRPSITDLTALETDVPELFNALGDNMLHGFGLRIANDTRNNPFLATEGHFVELQLEQVVGTFDYPRAILDARKYFLLRERPDHSGRHVLVGATKLGFTGSNTPIYENFFAGGFSTLRGFDFRGAGPVDTSGGINVEVGGEFMFINTVEYMFPITADDSINGVVFCDFGTVERKIEIEDFRVAPGVGLRLQIPAMGPAPIALDFAWPIAYNDTDDRQVFTFNVGFLR